MKKLIILSTIFLNLLPVLVFCEPNIDEKRSVDEMERLEKEIHEARLDAMKAEVNSEDHMKYEWQKYTDEIQKAENFDQKIQRLEKELQELKSKKTSRDE